MVYREPLTIEQADQVPALPDGPAVYLIHPREGRPYLGRTNILRKRITRLFAKWKLADVAGRLEYWPTASRLEQWLLSYEIAVRYFPEEYDRLLRLPKPAYVKLVANEFPRTQVTTRLAGAKSVFFGPFSSRANADLFETQFLDLFQLRRCQDDLAPSPEHPGCIYGEMRRCLRPCQEAVSAAEYASEASRVAEFLTTRGAKTLESTAAARDRASAQLEFEQAAQLHARHDRIEAVLRLPGDLAADAMRLSGVAITRSTTPASVLLWFLRDGCWLSPHEFSVAPAGGKTVSIDTRLREIFAALPEAGRATLQQRQDHLALLAKWFYSSWRDGEWFSVHDFNASALPYRKIVNAINRVVAQAD